MKTLTDLPKDIVAAMKEKNKEKVSTLRMLQASVQNKEIALKVETLDDTQFITLATKFKKDLETERGFIVQAGKSLESIDRQIELVNEYLPLFLSVEEIEKRVIAYISENKDTVDAIPERSRVGKLTGIMCKLLKGQAEAKNIGLAIRKVF